MGKRTEMEAKIRKGPAMLGYAKFHDRLKRHVLELADEVDELRGKLDDVRQGIGCARGQRTTQYCAEAAQRDEIITKLLEMLKPGDEPTRPLGDTEWAFSNYSIVRKLWMEKSDFYSRALEIAGRKD